MAELPVQYIIITIIILSFPCCQLQRRPFVVRFLVSAWLNFLSCQFFECFLHQCCQLQRRPFVLRFLVSAWLNFLANAQPATPLDLVDEAVRWLNATADQSVRPSDSAWSGCGDDSNINGTRYGCVNITDF